MKHDTFYTIIFLIRETMYEKKKEKINCITNFIS